MIINSFKEMPEADVIKILSLGREMLLFYGNSERVNWGRGIPKFRKLDTKIYKLINISFGPNIDSIKLGLNNLKKLLRIKK